jgi:hypothetical protein
MNQDGFHEEDEELGKLMAIFHSAAHAVTLPSAAFLRQVREAVAESYEGGSEMLQRWPESVQKYCEGDGGLLSTLDVAIFLLDERELADYDAGLLERIARWLDAYTQPERRSRWDDEPPEGWASREALRAAYREDALELLRIVVPAVADAVTQRFGDQLLPQLREMGSTMSRRRHKPEQT